MQVTWDYKLEKWGNRPEKSESKPDCRDKRERERGSERLIERMSIFFDRIVEGVFDSQLRPKVCSVLPVGIITRGRVVPSSGC